MLVEVEKGKYRNLSTDEDFFGVIEEKISWEFTEELINRFNNYQEYVNKLNENSDFSFIEQENEDLIHLIDDINSMIQSYIYPIEKRRDYIEKKQLSF